MYVNLWKERNASLNNALSNVNPGRAQHHLSEGKTMGPLLHYGLTFVTSHHYTGLLASSLRPHRLQNQSSAHEHHQNGHSAAKWIIGTNSDNYTPTMDKHATNSDHSRR